MLYTMLEGWEHWSSFVWMPLLMPSMVHKCLGRNQTGDTQVTVLLLKALSYGCWGVLCYHKKTAKANGIVVTIVINSSLQSGTKHQQVSYALQTTLFYCILFKIMHHSFSYTVHQNIKAVVTSATSLWEATRNQCIYICI